MKRLISVPLFAAACFSSLKGETAPPVDKQQVHLQASPKLKLRSTGEDALRFTLKEAENYALANHPQIAAANLTADAVRQEIREARSAFFPQIYGESTSVYARDGDTRLAAQDSLSNSSVFSRQSDGIVLSQLITDFGRTYELTETAHFHANAAADRANVARAVVVLAVDRSYFDVLQSDAVLRVADETVKARDTAFKQVSALAQSNLKSTLDVDFAQVSLSQAQLLQIQAESGVSEAEAALSTALGFPNAQHFILAEQPADENLAPDPDALIMQALQQRPELANLHDELEASRRFAKAQDAAQYPTITALGAAGVNPVAPHTEFRDTYYTAGVNVELPLANGGRLSAQAEEAHLMSDAAIQNLVDAQNNDRPRRACRVARRPNRQTTDRRERAAGSCGQRGPIIGRVPLSTGHELHRGVDSSTTELYPGGIGGRVRQVRFSKRRGPC